MSGWSASGSWQNTIHVTWALVFDDTSGWIAEAEAIVKTFEEEMLDSVKGEVLE